MTKTSTLTRAQREYQAIKDRALLGRRTDPHWNGGAWRHECCGSRAYWRHKVRCPWATGEGKLPPDTK